MTFDEFKEDFINWLKNSTVNLGRKQAKTRSKFLEDAAKKFDFYGGFDEDNFHNLDNEVNDPPKPIVNPMDDRIMCIKPKGGRQGLDVGKGVHAMTPSESMRADEELNRSPFTGKNDQK